MITLEFFGLVITLSCMLYGLNSMVRGFTQRKIEPDSFWHGYVVTGFGCFEPPRVSRRPNFLREYPNEKYLLT